MIRHCTPYWASVTAAISPVGPAPTTRTSVSTSTPGMRGGMFGLELRDLVVKLSDEHERLA